MCVVAIASSRQCDGGSFNVAVVVLQVKYSVLSRLVLVGVHACLGIVGDLERMQEMLLEDVNDNG